MKFTIPLIPRTKKNSMQVSFRGGKPNVRQSKSYLQYEQDCLKLITGQYRLHIDKPVNVKAIYYMPTRRRVDLINLHGALHDVLVKAGVLADDNCKIIVSTDGSRVKYDKESPRTVVEITKIN